MEEVTVEWRLEDEQGRYKWNGEDFQADNHENKDSKANKDRNPQNLEFSFSVGDRHSFKVLNRQFFVCASIILTAIYQVPPVDQQQGQMLEFKRCVETYSSCFLIEVKFT